MLGHTDKRRGGGSVSPLFEFLEKRLLIENFLYLFSGLYDGSVVIWNPLEENEENRKRILPQKHSDEVVLLSFSPDGRFLSSADIKGELIIWLAEVRKMGNYLCNGIGGTGRDGRDVTGCVF